ncbi:MAG TPA: hypothetical protein VGE41_01020 [Verrucomicrobiae bacterium]
MLTNRNGAIIVPPTPAPTQAAAGTNDIRPAKPPVPVPNSFAWALWIGGILLAAIGLAWLLGWWTRKRAVAQIVPVIPPHIRARQRLDAALQLISDPKAFCIAVSDALRMYLEERFQFHAPERTTEEFLLELQNTSLLSQTQKASLAGFLGSCDLVKFARFEPEETDLRALHTSALRLVDETQYDPFQATERVSDAPPPVKPEVETSAPPPPPVPTASS